MITNVFVDFTRRHTANGMVDEPGNAYHRAHLAVDVFGCALRTKRMDKLLPSY